MRNEVNQEPETLACQHSICKTCLQEYVHTKEEAATSKAIPCPTCRQETTVPHPQGPVEEWAGQLKPGLLLTGLMASVVEDTICSMCNKDEKTPASVWCEDCENCFCEDCLKLHDRVPLCSDHTVSKLTDNQQNRAKQSFICREHDEKIKVFCKDCKKALCTVCCSLSHRKCEDVVTINEILPEVKDELMKHQERLGKRADKRQAEIAKYENVLDKFLVKSATVKTDITKTLQAVVNQLHEKEVDLLGKIDFQTDQETVRRWSEIKTKQRETQMYQHQSQSIQQALELENEAQLFEMYLSSVAEAEEDADGDGSTPVAALSLTFDLDKLSEGIKAMDVRSFENASEVEASPEVEESMDTKLDSENSSLRDADVLSTSDTKSSVFAGLKKRLKSAF